MQKEFWLNCWRNNDIGFHEDKANVLLTENFNFIKLNRNSRILIPLCGKSNDIHWFLNQGMSVVGIELSQIAIDELFIDLNIRPTIKNYDHFQHYSAKNIDIFVGDIFDITKEIIGKIDAIYDRAALVALPHDLRTSYSKHLITLSNSAKQLLITFDYNQSQMNGPPFSINEKEISRLYKNTYIFKILQEKDVTQKLKNIAAKETIWLLEASTKKMHSI